MKTDFFAEIAFIQSNILFIYNKDLEKILIPSLDYKLDMISIDCNVLWELIELESKDTKLALHISFPNILNIITIYFCKSTSIELQKKINFDTLGILIGFNQMNNNSRYTIFIPEINEGLKLINKG